MEHISKIVYINLGRRKDRRRHMEKLIKKYGHGIPYERFPAIWPKHQDRVAGGQYHDYQQRLYKDYKKVRARSRGVLGCYLSHYFIHKKALEENWGNYLVVEDDVNWGASTLKHVNLIIERGLLGDDWDILRSTWRDSGSRGWWRAVDKNRPIRFKGCPRQSKFWKPKLKMGNPKHCVQNGGTHFQLINGNRTQEIVDYLDSDKIWNIDSMYSTCLMNVWRASVGVKLDAFNGETNIPKDF